MNTKDTNIVVEELHSFLDGELSVEQQSQVQERMAAHLPSQQFFQEQQELSTLIRSNLYQKTEEFSQYIDFDQCADQIMQRIHASPEEKQRVIPDKEPSNFLSQMWKDSLRWVQTRPVLATSLGGCFAIAIVFSLPLIMDSGSKPNDCIVEKAVGTKKPQFAVLQTKNNHTGQPMTLIVVDEPEKSELSKAKEPSNKHLNSPQPQRKKN